MNADRDRSEAPAGPPLHEQADRDGDNVPSDRRYAEFEVWDSSVPPGGMVCRECGTPVESEPCYQHNRAAREDRYAEAIDPGAFAETQPYPGRDPRPLWRQMAVQNARAVMAVADRELAELRAEIARLTHLLGSHADGHRCTCTMIDPGNFYVGGGNAHPPEWEQDPWCPTHPDVNQIKGELRNLALTWDADADASEDTHPKEARAVLSCARELLAVLRGPEPTEGPS